MTNKEKVLKEFEDSIQYCPSLDEPNEYCSNMGCEQCYMDNTLPKQKQFISGLVDKMEAEKQEAVSGIIDFISDQDSIIDSTYKTYELLQSDIEYLKNKYLKELNE